MTLTFDLWPWTFVVYRLCSGQILYQIWAQSSNLRRSYCHLNIWPNNLKLVSRVGLGSGIIFTRFESVNLSVPTFSLQIRYVTLWPSLLTRWPWTFVVDRSGVMWGKVRWISIAPHRKVCFVCWRQVKLCDLLVTHGPYLSALEMLRDKALYKITYNLVYLIYCHVQ